MDEEKNETEETKDETEGTSDKGESLEAKLTRLERENKRLHRKVGQLETLAPKEDKKESKPDEVLLKRLDSLALKTAGITESDEKELYEKWRTDTGREPEAILDNSIFKKELEDMRTARKNLAATSDIKGETGISEAKANPDYWTSRITKDGQGNPLFPDDMPREMYTKVLDKLNPKSQGTKLRFYNSPK